MAAVLVPIGGGGLASGVATAVKALRPDARVIGVEPELAADARDSLARGEIVRWSAERRRRGRSPTGRGRRPSAVGRSPTCGPTSTAIVTVTEAEIAAGVRLAAERSRLVAEPSGALAVAAMAFRRPSWASIEHRWARRRRSSAAATWTRTAYRAYLEAPTPAAESASSALARQALGQACLADADLRELGGGAAVRTGRVARLGPHPAIQDREDRDRGRSGRRRAT